MIKERFKNISFGKSDRKRPGLLNNIVKLFKELKYKGSYSVIEKSKPIRGEKLLPTFYSNSILCIKISYICTNEIIYNQAYINVNSSKFIN